MSAGLNMSQWNFWLVPQNVSYWMLMLAIKINTGCGMPQLYLLSPIRRTDGRSINFLKRELVLPVVTRDNFMGLVKAWTALQIFIIKHSNH